MWQFDFFKAAPSHSTAREGRRPPKKSPELPSVLVKKSEGVNVDREARCSPQGVSR